jgi:hypothetical protein
MASGGARACRSRGRRDAIANPVSFAASFELLTRIWVGFKSLCTSLCLWSSSTADATFAAIRMKVPISIGVPINRSSGSPSEPSITGPVRPCWRTKFEWRRSPRGIRFLSQYILTVDSTKDPGLWMRDCWDKRQDGAALDTNIREPIPAEETLAVLLQNLPRAVRVVRAAERCHLSCSGDGAAHRRSSDPWRGFPPGE